MKSSLWFVFNNSFCPQRIIIVICVSPLIFLCSRPVKGERIREEWSPEHFVLFRLGSTRPAADAQQARPSTSLFSRREDENVPPYKESSIASDSSSVMQ